MSEDEKILATCKVEIIDTHPKGGQVAGWRSSRVELTCDDMGVKFSINTTVDRQKRIKSLLEELYVLMCQDRRFH